MNDKKNVKRKFRFDNLFVLILIPVFIVLIIISGYKITHYIYNTKQTEELTEELESYITVSDLNEDDIKIDFDKLRQDNSDTIAWIRVNNTNINYPVVKGKDNDYYLRHNFKKNYSESGWVFASYLNKFDGTDDNLVIFGHAMKNKTMFGDLNQALNKEYYDNEYNRKIQLIVDNEVQVYRIFSIYTIAPEDYYITTKFNSREEYKTFIDTIKKRSIYKFNDEVNENNKVLTLSTCYNNDRLVVHAYRVL